MYAAYPGDHSAMTKWAAYGAAPLPAVQYQQHTNLAAADHGEDGSTGAAAAEALAGRVEGLEATEAQAAGECPRGSNDSTAAVSTASSVLAAELSTAAVGDASTAVGAIADTAGGMGEGSAFTQAAVAAAAGGSERRVYVAAATAARKQLEPLACLPSPSLLVPATDSAMQRSSCNDCNSAATRIKEASAEAAGVTGLVGAGHRSPCRLLPLASPSAAQADLMYSRQPMADIAAGRDAGADAGAFSLSDQQVGESARSSAGSVDNMDPGVSGTARQGSAAAGEASGITRDQRGLAMVLEAGRRRIGSSSKQVAGGEAIAATGWELVGGQGHQSAGSAAAVVLTAAIAAAADREACTGKGCLSAQFTPCGDSMVSEMARAASAAAGGAPAATPVKEVGLNYTTIWTSPGPMTTGAAPMSTAAARDKAASLQPQQQKQQQQWEGQEERHISQQQLLAAVLSSPSGRKLSSNLQSYCRALLVRKQALHSSADQTTPNTA